MKDFLLWQLVNRQNAMYISDCLHCGSSQWSLFYDQVHQKSWIDFPEAPNVSRKLHCQWKLSEDWQLAPFHFPAWHTYREMIVVCVMHLVWVLRFFCRFVLFHPCFRGSLLNNTYTSIGACFARIIGPLKLEIRIS